MSQKAFDPSKFRTSLTKAITGMSAGFKDPSIWIDTGNYVLNYLISGSFYKGVPLGKVAMFAGESGCLPESASVRIRSKIHPELITTINVGKLRDLYHSEDKDNFEIATPDGYRRITEWFDKGEMTMVKVTTATYSTTCATNHMLETEKGHWVKAINLYPGTRVKTESGFLPVIKVTKAKPQRCYDFTIDHPNHRYWGDGFSSHNSGKSYVCAGNIVKDAQKKGIYVVLIDTENALDESWLQKLDVDTSEDKLLKLNMAMIDDVAKTISTFMKDYKELEPADRPQVLFVIDSLGMLMTPTEVSQFDSGDLKGDMGRKPKALKALITNCVNMFGEYNVGLVATNHTYDSQSLFAVDQKISGGSGPMFASSIVVQLQKRTLREDEYGAKTSDLQGIKASCKVVKTRYAKPFESVDIHIPYDKGMNKYSGLIDFFEKAGVMTLTGRSYIYVDSNGVEHKNMRRNWTPEKLDMVMEDFERRHFLEKTPASELDDTGIDNDSADDLET